MSKQGKRLGLLFWIFGTAVLLFVGIGVWQCSQTGGVVTDEVKAGQSPITAADVAPSQVAPQSASPSVMTEVAPIARTQVAQAVNKVRPAAQWGVWEHLPNPRVLETQLEPQADGTVRRSRLVQIEFKYPYVRVEDTLTGADALQHPDTTTALDQVAMVADHVLVKAAAGVNDAQMRAAIESAGLNVVEAAGGQGAYIVQLPDTKLSGVPDILARLKNDARLDYAEPDYFVYTCDMPPGWSDDVVQALTGGNTSGNSSNAITQPGLILEGGNVAFAMVAGATGNNTLTLTNSGTGNLTWTLVSQDAETVQTQDLDPATQPNDPSFSAQWDMLDPKTNTAGIDAVHAWSVTTGDPSIIVAVIDTGVDLTHPDLVNNIWTNPDEIAGNNRDDDKNGFVDDVHGWNFVSKNNDPNDDNGHGTHVSGTIAASGNNALNIAGIAWNVKIMPLKFLNSTGSGVISDAAKAINYAIGKGARIMSNSWGVGIISQTVLNAVIAARNAGCLFVAAAGNNGSNNDTKPFYPASYAVDNILAVAATDSNNKLASFSNYGPTSVLVAAPGVNTLSLWLNNGTNTLSGTSMATPHVSGVAALLWSQNPALTYTEVKQLIAGGANTFANLSTKISSGGTLDAYRSLKASLPDWVQASALGGTVSAGGNQSVSLIFDTSQLVSGTHTGNFVLQTNAAGKATVNIPVTLQVLTSTDYHLWQAQQFGANGILNLGNESAAWGDAATPANDNNPNLLKYAMGMPVDQSTVQNTVTTLGDDGLWQFGFPVREDVSGFNYEVVWSEDLVAGDWTSDGISQISDTTDAMPPGIHWITVELDQADLQKVFFKVTVQESL